MVYAPRAFFILRGALWKGEQGTAHPLRGTGATNLTFKDAVLDSNYRTDEALVRMLGAEMYAGQSLNIAKQLFCSATSF